MYYYLLRGPGGKGYCIYMGDEGSLRAAAVAVDIIGYCIE